MFEIYDKHLENIPKTNKRSAKALLQELKTNEVTLDGIELGNSNLVDLVADITRSIKTVTLPFKVTLPMLRNLFNFYRH